MELKGTTAIITGSSGRLGSAIARALATAGCNCICHYNSNRQKAKELVGRVQETGEKAVAVKADLTKSDEIENLFEKALEFGEPRILINSAAVFSRQPLADVTFEESQKVLNLNLIAPILTSRAFAKFVDEKYGKAESVVGKIINIADVGGIRPWAGSVLYCSSKAGLIGATKALAKELAPRVCVNSIAPGVVTWPGDFDESEKKRQLSFIPVRRIPELNEITGAMVFLLKNDYVTGQVLNVDGGRCI
ncbi:MAG: SDR family NAD(P)-dependent oxidoreductase [Planctomycetota bacterium]|jgi:NAD(P)-dependent dehydrogenase (short-subunit alcohol dehydrogenase family)